MNVKSINLFLIALIAALSIVQWGAPLAHPRVIYPENFKQAKVWLNHVDRAGFYSDSSNSKSTTDPKFAFYYQWAQLVLSPTLLDYEQPFLYDYLIVRMNTSDLNGLKNRYPWREAKYLGEQFYLLKR
jgi:hypothetical protein